MSCPTCEPQPSLAALQRAYEAACVVFCERYSTAWDPLAPKVQPMRDAKAALDAALLRQQQESQDEGIIAAIQGIYSGQPVRCSDGWRTPMWGLDYKAASSILSALRAAGFEVTRKQDP